MSEARVRPAELSMRSHGARFGPVVLVVVVSLAVGILSSPEVHWGDAQRSFWYAYYWPDIPLDHHGLRIGLLAITRVFIALFGPGEVAFVATSLFLWGLLAVGTFVAGRELFGTAVGFAATALVLFNPFLVEGSTYLTTGLILPDVPSAGLIALGIAAASVGLRCRRETARHWLILAGFLLAWGYLVREFAAVMFIALPVLAWARHRPVRTLLPTVATMATILVVETLINSLVYGQPLARLRVSSEHGGVQPAPIEPADAILRLWSFASERPSAIAINISLAILLVATVLSRDRFLIVCWVWLGAFWVTLSLAGGLLDPVSPSLRTILVRYWVPAFVPLSIGAAGGVWLVFRRLGGIPEPRTAAGLLGAFVALLLATYSLLGLNTARQEPDGAAWRELRGWVVQESPERLVADSFSRDVLAFYIRSPLGDEIWDGCVASYWRGRDVVPQGLGGPILVSPTTPDLPETMTGDLMFESRDGSIKVIDPNSSPETDVSAGVDEDVFVASRLELCE